MQSIGLRLCVEGFVMYKLARSVSECVCVAVYECCVWAPVAWTKGR